MTMMETTTDWVRRLTPFFLRRTECGYFLTNSLGIGCTSPFGSNQIALPANTAEALSIIDENEEEYIRIVSSTSQPIIWLNPNVSDIDVTIATAASDTSFCIRGSDGHIGINTAPSTQMFMSLRNMTANVTNIYMGFENIHYKTTGASDYTDALWGIKTSMRLSQSGSESGTVTGLEIEAAVTAGTIGNVSNPRHLYGLVLDTVTYAGATVTGNLWGAMIFNSHASGAVISGDACGIYLYASYAGTVTGTSYMIYLYEVTGVDYGIYQNGIAPHYLGGKVAIGGTVTATAQLHVDQSSDSAAIPTLLLDQADLSEEFIEFTTTVGAGNPIDTAAIGTYYGKARVSVTGVGDKFVALYNS